MTGQVDGGEAIKKLVEHYDHVVSVYRENGKTDYDAGRVEGLKEALEVLAQFENSPAK